MKKMRNMILFFTLLTIVFQSCATTRNVEDKLSLQETIDIPLTAEAFLDRGILFATRGEFTLAIEDFTNAILLNPNYAKAYQLRARALFANVSEIFEIEDNFKDVITFWINGKNSEKRMQGYERAISDYNQAIRLDPNNAVSYDGLGRVYADRGDVDIAIENFNQAIRLNPNYAAAYNQRGGAYQRKGNDIQAIADFTQAIRLDLNYAVAYYNRGTAYRRNGDLDRAIADFNKVISINPNHAPAYNNRGVAYSSKGDSFCAISDYTEAIRIDPNNPVRFINRGFEYALIGDYYNAIADLEIALRLNPNDEETRELLEYFRQH